MSDREPVEVVGGDALRAGATPWLLSARSRDALRAQAERLRAHVAVDGALDPVDVGFSLAHRPLLEERAVVLGHGRDELQRGIGALARGESAGNLIEGAVPVGDGGLAFLFTGQGAQLVGMGRELYERFPVFRAAFDEACAHLDEHLGCSLREVVFGAEGEFPAGAGEGSGGVLLDDTLFTQPGLFAFEVALFKLVSSLGVHPGFVMGHSVGELAAAHVAGVLSLQDACRLVAARGRLMSELPAGGAMVSVRASAREALASLEGFEGRVELAAVNGPSAVVFSGDADAVLELARTWRARGRKTKRLRVSHAFHSPRMDGMLERFARVAQELSFSEPRFPVVSDLTGEVASPEQLCDPAYWVRHVRETVRFADGVRRLGELRVTSFLELGPDAVLTAMVRDCIAEADAARRAPGAAVPAQRAGRGEEWTLLAGLAALWVRGVEVDWSVLFDASGAERVELPTYAFQRERFWLQTGATARPGGASGDADVLDRELWAAVEHEDVEGLVGALGGNGAELRPSWEAVLPVLAGWRRGRVERSLVDGWRYRARWTPARTRELAAPAAAWLVAAPAGRTEDPLIAGVVAALAARSVRPLVVEVDRDLADREELAGHLRELLAEEGALGGVLSLLALGGGHDRLPGAGDGGGGGSWGGLVGVLVLAQALGDAAVRAPLWCVTRGGVSVGVGDRVVSPAAGLAWGLGRTFGLEQPGRWGGLVDLPAEPDARALERLCEVLASAGWEDELAVRAGAVYARRLVRAPLVGRGAVREYRPRGTVLVTGGTGALGAHVARWLAHRGAAHLLLASRRGPDAPGAAALVRELEELGAAVTVSACDVADRGQLEGVLASVPGELPLSGVFHVAGVPSDDDAVDRLPVGRLESVLAAKAGGAWWLHELTAEVELDAFVLFSSLAGALGSGGQGAYAAANAFLDALAEHRRGRGMAATSVAWGAWAGAGMASGGTELLGRRGIRAMPPESALAALRAALEADDGCVVVADLDWGRYALTYSSARARPLIGELPEVRRVLRDAAGELGEGAAERGGLLAERFVGMAEGEREIEVLELVCARAAAVLGHSSARDVPAERAFRELGFDSLASVELAGELSAATGLRLSATVVFDHPTPEALAAHLLEELMGADRGARPSERSPARVAARAAGVAEDPVAIVGMSCRFPGGVDSPRELWELLARGGDAIGSFPTDRGWDLEGLYDPDPQRRGKSYAREGGFLYDAAEFDAAFFEISPREALAMDPQQRLLLEACWEAVEHAGISLTSLKGSPTGVFAGVAPSGYGGPHASLAEPGIEGYWLTGASGSVVSGRIAYTFGLEGPAVTVDTACSSSLVALHLACGALRGGECELALAGGVTVLANPDVFVEFSRQRGLAPDGRCKAFAAAADGTGWSEGVGVLLLERLSDARRRGHRALALVRGSALNQDGASNGLSAPNGPSQQRVIMQALASADLQPGDVDAVEAHGTGTELGDPIEAQALLATYGQGRPSDRPLWLGSVKSNLGHTQAAAGVAGVIKMVLALQHGALPRTLHVDEPSARVDWSAGEVSLLVDEVPWEPGATPRRAGISAFGIAGTNAHVILEEAPRGEPWEAPTAPGLAPSAEAAAPGVPLPDVAAIGVSLPDVASPGVPPSVVARPDVAVLHQLPWALSGADAQSLRRQAGRLQAFVAGERDLGVADVGCSLAARTPLAHRAVVCGADRDEPAGWGLRAGARRAIGHCRQWSGCPGRSAGGVPVHRPGCATGWHGPRVLRGSPGVPGGIRRGVRPLRPPPELLAARGRVRRGRFLRGVV